MAASPLRALITAGGTREPIDDVRVVTNLSRGRFGAALAHALADRGVEVVVLGSAELLRDPRALDPRVQRVSFATFADLARELDRLVVEQPPDFLFMAAAVSDYSPIPFDGKIPSREDELVIRLRRNPKLLATLRDKCGVETFLVGFKLLSGAAATELAAAAHRQVRQDRLNLTVANDLGRLTESLHPVLLVTPEGGAIPVEGSRDEVAGRIAEFALRRHQVRRFRSEPAGPPPSPAARDEGFHRAAGLLAFAQEANLLPALDGNVSARGSRGLWTTPRQVPKATLSGDDLLAVEADLPSARLRFHGARKPSIDSAVHAWLYRRLPGIDALLHFHRALVLSDAETTFPYPCGSVEEAEEIHRALALAARSGRWSGDGFAVHMADHGHLLGFSAAQCSTLQEAWRSACARWTDHMREIGGPPRKETVRLSPVFQSTRILGVYAECAGGAHGSLFLAPDARGSGAGERLLELLEQRGDTLAVHDSCGVLPYYVERGWRPTGVDGPLTLLQSPTRRDDLRLAVSVCLLDPRTRRILLGRRRTDPWKDHWTFPGGHVAAAESLLAAAARELAEETGLELPDSAPVAARTVYLGTGGGTVGFAVHCFCFHTLDPAAPKSGAELESVWLPLEEARARRPLAPGTRRVLQALSWSDPARF